jgi:glycosyltransferase involved in cell wall biosynthesis
MRDLRLSVVIPIYNELDNIVPLYVKVAEAVSALSPTFVEILFVDDGSTDGSAVALDRLEEENANCRVLHLDQNHGQTAAMAAGFDSAQGHLIVTMDGDLQNDPADIHRLLPHMKKGIGCVAGVRVKRSDPWIKRVSSKVANAVRNRVTGESIQDTGCSLKLYRKHALDQLTLFDGMHRFLPTLINMTGYGVVEVPVGHYARYAGKSKYGVLNRLFKTIPDLLAVRWMKKRHLRYKILESKAKIE